VAQIGLRLGFDAAPIPHQLAEHKAVGFRDILGGRGCARWSSSAGARSRRHYRWARKGRGLGAQSGSGKTRHEERLERRCRPLCLDGEYECVVSCVRLLQSHSLCLPAGTWRGKCRAPSGAMGNESRRRQDVGRCPRAARLCQKARLPPASKSSEITSGLASSRVRRELVACCKMGSVAARGRFSALSTRHTSSSIVFRQTPL